MRSDEYIVLYVPKSTPSIGSSLFETFMYKEKHSLYNVYCMYTSAVIYMLANLYIVPSKVGCAALGNCRQRTVDTINSIYSAEI